MSGHSKWSKIKHKKAATDAKKSAEFSRLAKQIAIESREAQGDVNSPGLRMIMEKAKKTNMPNENIMRAVAKGSGADAGTLESTTYETYGPGGVAILVNASTDNKNRTAAEIKHLLGTYGYELATPGSASWAFEKSPEGEWAPKTTIPLSSADNENLASLVEALEANDDVDSVFTNVQ